MSAPLHHRFFSALTFLTILPAPKRWMQADLSLAVPFFPLVGLVMGAIAASVGFIFFLLFPPAVAGAISAITLLGLSGGLHMDGLADTADGFLSARPREKVLAIMRDSRTGAMGVMAVAAILLIKCAALGSMDGHTAWRALFLMPVAGRSVKLGLMAWLPYARPEGGMVTPFFEQSRHGAATFSAFVLGITALLLYQSAGIAMLLILPGATILFGRLCRRRIGGLTGDTLGAMSEIAETLVAVSASSPFFLQLAGL